MLTGRRRTPIRRFARRRGRIGRGPSSAELRATPPNSAAVLETFWRRHRAANICGKRSTKASNECEGRLATDSDATGGAGYFPVWPDRRKRGISYEDGPSGSILAAELRAQARSSSPDRPAVESLRDRIARVSATYSRMSRVSFQRSMCWRNADSRCRSFSALSSAFHRRSCASCSAI